VSELQHPDARPFEIVADLYERVRPEYPEEAIDWLVEQLRIDAGSTVLDLGAGTGKLTRALAARAACVIAVEPGQELLARLRVAVPEAEAVHGAAEQIPLPDASVDAVVCGQSFHWFRAEEAIPEIRRVLRAGGGLGLVWNVRHPGDPVQEEISELLKPFVPPDREALPTRVRGLVERAFGAVESYSVDFEQELDADGVAGRILSISFVAAASAAEQDELERKLRALVAARRGRVAFRYRAEAFVVLSVA
jgi:SAM-dependent methyltransferase